MARKILPDTDILVDFFRGYEKAVAFVKNNSHRIVLSSIVVAELYAGVKEGAEKSALDNFISLFRVVPVTAEIAALGGLYKRDYGKSHGVALADGILAATAEMENAELVTLNIKHYPMLKGISRLTRSTGRISPKSRGEPTRLGNSSRNREGGWEDIALQ